MGGNISICRPIVMEKSNPTSSDSDALNLCCSLLQGMWQAAEPRQSLDCLIAPADACFCSCCFNTSCLTPRGVKGRLETTVPALEWRHPASVNSERICQRWNKLTKTILSSLLVSRTTRLIQIENANTNKARRPCSHKDRRVMWSRACSITVCKHGWGRHVMLFTHTWLSLEPHSYDGMSSVWDVPEQIITLRSVSQNLRYIKAYEWTLNKWLFSQTSRMLVSWHLVFCSFNSYIYIKTAEPVPLPLCLPLRTVLWTVCQPSTAVSDL